jgi:hypothetical protein
MAGDAVPMMFSSCSSRIVLFCVLGWCLAAGTASAHTVSPTASRTVHPPKPAPVDPACDCDAPSPPASCECEDETEEPLDLTALDLVFVGRGFAINSLELTTQGLPRNAQITVSDLYASDSLAHGHRLKVKGGFTLVPSWTLTLAVHGAPAASSGSDTSTGVLFDRAELGGRVGVTRTWPLGTDSTLSFGGGLDLSHLFSGATQSAADAPIDRLALGLWGVWSPRAWEFHLEGLVPLLTTGAVPVATATSIDALSATYSGEVVPARALVSLEAARALGAWSIDVEAAVGSYVDGALRMHALGLVERQLPAGFSVFGGGGVDRQSFPTLATEETQPFAVFGCSWNYLRAFGKSAPPQD